MLYCENCMTLLDEAKCPKCKSRDLRQVQPEDPVLLATKEAIWAEMAEDVLGQNGIRVLKRGVLGAGVTSRLGTGLETFRLYVPYARLEAATALMEELFPADYGITLPQEDGE